MPPNSKNGAFVYNDTLVRAQVKLELVNSQGQEVTCSRSLSLSMLGGKSTCRTIESTIQTLRNGEKTSVSQKCADIDLEMQAHLGVSKPILDNVIFCHQEESFWPLAEPTVLKKKFDDIFSATRYTKALKSLSDCKKSLVADLRVVQVEVSHSRENKQKAAQVQIRLVELRKQESQLQERVRQLDSTEIAQCVAQMSNLLGRQREFQNLRTLHQQNLLECDMHKKSIESLMENIEFMQESDQQLAELQNEQHDSIAEFETKESTLEAERMMISDEMVALSSLLSDNFTKRGKLQAEHNLIVRKSAQRQEVCQSLQKNYPSPSGLAAISEDQVGDYVSHLKKQLQLFQRSLEQEQRSAQTRETELQLHIQQQMTQLASFEENRRMSLSRLETLTKNVQESESTLQGIENLTESLETVQSAIQFDQAALDHVSHTDSQSDKSNIANLTAQLNEALAKSAQLSSKMSDFHSQSDTRARIALKQTEAHRRNETQQRLIAMITPQMRTYGLAYSNQAATELKNLQSLKSQALSNSKEAYWKATNRQSVLDVSIAKLATELEESKDELLTKKRKLDQIVGLGDFVTDLHQAEVNADREREHLASLKSAGGYFHFIQNVQKIYQKV